jgi:hypothetical protein
MNGRIKKRNEVAPSTFGALPMIGKLKIGMKVWNEKAKREIPTSLDYFRATGPYAEKFHDPACYGKQPGKVEIVFPSDDIMQVCREEIEGRSEKNGKRYGFSHDGVVYYLWDEKEEDYLPTEDQIAIDTFTKQNHVTWKYTLFLNFVVLKMRGVLGQWQFSTKGEKSSMPQIIKAFDTMREGIGTIVNVPFDLQVEKATSQKPIKNKKTGKLETRTFPVVKLVPNISPENMDTLRGYLTTHTDFKKFGVIMSDERIESLRNDNNLALDTDPAKAAQEELYQELHAFVAFLVECSVLSQQKQDVLEDMHTKGTYGSNHVPVTLSTYQAVYKRSEDALLAAFPEMSATEVANLQHACKHGDDLEEWADRLYKIQSQRLEEVPPTPEDVQEQVDGEVDDANPFAEGLVYVKKVGSADDITQAETLMNANNEAGFTKYVDSLKAANGDA